MTKNHIQREAVERWRADLLQEKARPGTTEPYQLGDEYVYKSHKGHNYVEILGVLYDHDYVHGGTLGNPDADMILMVNRTSSPQISPQYSAGRVYARRRYEMDRRWKKRTLPGWIKNARYMHKDDHSELVIVAVFEDGTAIGQFVHHDTANPIKMTADGVRHWKQVSYR